MRTFVKSQACPKQLNLFGGVLLYSGCMIMVMQIKVTCEIHAE